MLSNLEITEFEKFLWQVHEFGSPQNFSHPIISKLDSM